MMAPAFLGGSFTKSRRPPAPSIEKLRRDTPASIKATAQSREALSAVPARQIVKCCACGREYHIDWGGICPDCSGAD